MVLLLRKLFLYCTKDPEGCTISGGGGWVQLFPGGVGGPNANFNRNPYNLRFSRGGGPDPLSPSGSAHGQCRH